MLAFEAGDTGSNPVGTIIFMRCTMYNEDNYITFVLNQDKARKQMWEFVWI